MKYLAVAAVLALVVGCKEESKPVPVSVSEPTTQESAKSAERKRVSLGGLSVQMELPADWKVRATDSGATVFGMTPNGAVLLVASRLSDPLDPKANFDMPASDFEPFKEQLRVPKNEGEVRKVSERASEDTQIIDVQIMPGAPSSTRPTTAATHPGAGEYSRQIYVCNPTATGTYACYRIWFSMPMEQWTKDAAFMERILQSVSFVK